MYVSPNFKTKKALKEAVANGEQVTVFQPNDMFNRGNMATGTICVEGPHYPKPHTWYASVTLENGRIVKVS